MKTAVWTRKWVRALWIGVLGGMLVASSLQAALSPLANPQEVILFADDFVNNANGWSAIGTGSGQATIGPDPGGTGEAVWYPSNDSDNTEVQSFLTLSQPADINKDKISAYFRVRVDDIDNVNANRFHLDFFETTTSRVGGYRILPGALQMISYRDSAGTLHHDTSLPPPFALNTTNNFVDFRLTFQKVAANTMRLEASYYSGGNWVLQGAVTNAHFLTGEFSRLFITSRNASGGSNRAYFDSVMITIPEPGVAALLMVGGLMVWRGCRR